MVTKYNGREIAIIGMACKFPDANSPEKYWEHLSQGKTAVKYLDASTTDTSIPKELTENPNYVNAHIPLEDSLLFDAAFFDFNPKEAALMDPQHRLFLETCWEAMERSGYKVLDNNNVGVFSGCAPSSYILNMMRTHPHILNNADFFQSSFVNDKDYLATRASYKLGLTGPSIGIQTACSTSLVTVHYACQSLLMGECDMAIAGGSSIRFPENVGYVYQKGQILSPDGQCRPFDKDASGTIFGNGLGVVVLKRLEDALEDNDIILSTIKASAVNNDGNQKIGYTAPSIQGQTMVIKEALEMAEVSANNIGYIETHGTGTVLGDPIEIEALHKAYGEEITAEHEFLIGSVKPNIGHLDTAAGIAGLIKSVLMLQHQEIPPSLHFNTPNPKIDFDNIPFRVTDKKTNWETTPNQSRMAGVSSFGIGGTNAHVILEEHITKPVQSHDKPSLIVLSAKTEKALQQMIKNLVNHLEKYPQQQLQNIAYTLQVGRVTFSSKIAFIANNTSELQVLLNKGIQDLINVSSNVNNSENSYWSAIAEQWLVGESIDWNLLYAEKDVKRVCLPTYPFERNYYGVETLEKSTEATSERTAYTNKIYAAPEGKLETDISARLCDILGFQEIGRDDDLYELGLDSLNVTQLMSWIHNTYRIELDFEDVLESTTVAGIASIITEQITTMLAAMSEEEATEFLQLL